MGTLWTHVDVEQVAQHCRGQEAEDHATKDLVALEGLLKQLQVATQGMVNCITTALNDVVLTLVRQTAQQEATDNLLGQLLPLNSSVEASASSSSVAHVMAIHVGDIRALPAGHCSWPVPLPLDFCGCSTGGALGTLQCHGSICAMLTICR